MSKNHLTNLFWGLSNNAEFTKGIQHAINHIQGQVGIDTGDNLLTFNRFSGRCCVHEGRENARDDRR
mgnify:CR=1 FL=1|jgi:hypothetical protein